MINIISQAKEYFFTSFAASDPAQRLYDELPRHVPIVEKWAERLLTKHKEANREILLVSVWLHDIGQAFGTKEEDHAVKSERVAMQFLPTVGVSEVFVQSVAHCVRAHRCKDVQPSTIEAKLLAAADSASHFTDAVYIDIMNKNGKKTAEAKLERDYRDVGLFPDLREDITPLYNSWKNLISTYPRWFTADNKSYDITVA